MNQPDPPKDAPKAEERTTEDAGRKDTTVKAEHGARSDVNWDGGRGREPYVNQEAGTAADAAGEDFSEGDRGELSGRNLEQLEAVRRKP